MTSSHLSEFLKEGYKIVGSNGIARSWARTLNEAQKKAHPGDFIRSADPGAKLYITFQVKG